ncbi:MAG: four helix bundle protein [Planctomycetota bacterium]|jgi:four helix bundle protein
MTKKKTKDKSVKYDLEERTAKFGEAIIEISKKIPRTPVTEPLIRQLIKAGTSVGANYCEADDAISRREFRKFIGICRREARESKHWLRMIASAAPNMKTEARTLWREAKELHLIFAKAFKSTSEKLSKER